MSTQRPPSYRQKVKASTSRMYWPDVLAGRTPCSDISSETALPTRAPLRAEGVFGTWTFPFPREIIQNFFRGFRGEKNIAPRPTRG